MKLKIKNKVIYDENGEVIGAICESAPDEAVTLIEASGDALESIREFVSDVNNGNLKPRAAVKEFEKVLYKYGY